ncbi:MAG TPA: hypothetical protein VJS12_23150 [Steroidobacteraceae bacterium]|nr:hypothetical protein [Steroidobacteraceae bacterium]
MSAIPHRSNIYLSAGLLVTLIAFVGFWPSYFGPLLAGTLAKTQVIHVHAVVQVVWLALLMTQIALAATGRTRLHMRLGKWVFAWGLVVIIVGLVLSFEIFAGYIAAGDAPTGQRRMFAFLRDMLFFTPFLIAGWFYRRRPEVHKRLMLTAATILLLPAVSRMTFLGPPPQPVWIFMLVWPIPIYILMIYDYATRRLIHPVYVIGVLAMLAMRVMLPLRTTEAWLTVSGWLVGLYS